MMIKNISFKARYETLDILGVTTQKVLKKDGMPAITKIVNELNSQKAVGGRCIKKLAQKAGKKITDKYPDINSATNEINALYGKNHGEKPANLDTLLNSITQKLGQELDITI